MTLNIEVKADINGLRGLARWCGTGSESVHDAGTDVIKARGDAESEWGGKSGAAFQGVMGKFAPKVDEVSTDMDSAKTAVNVFADDMDTVKSRMRQAHEIATKAGLSVTDTQIEHPGAAPAGPRPLPQDGSATADEKSAATSAQSAVDDHSAKLKAYNEASQVVSEARGKETVALGHLAKFGNDQVGKLPLTAADVSSGLAAEAIKKTSKFRAMAKSYSGYAERAFRMTAGKSVTSPAFARAAQLNAQFVAKQRTLLDDALKTMPRNALDKLPGFAKGFLASDLGQILPKNPATGLGRVGKAVLGKVPVVGTLVTAAGIGMDISQGKDPTKAVASGVSSLAAGAAVGAVVGGPVGVVLGAAVGAGVGYVVDEWGDEIGGAAKDVGSAIGDGATSVGNFVGDLF